MSVGALVGRFYGEFWNERRLDVAAEILHPDVTFRGSVGASARGRDAVSDYAAMVTTALADYRCDVEHLVADDGAAAARVRFSGRHVGTFLGHEPTNRQVSWIGAAFFTVHDGLLGDIWVLGDLVSLHAQLAARAEN
jgi:steroid delta-isomerase-like uncharacterized protein